MQKCTSRPPCANGTVSKERRKQVTVTIDPAVLKLLDKKMAEHGETNKSDLIEYLMQCWIYSCDGACDPKCPFYEESAAAAKKS